MDRRKSELQKNGDYTAYLYEICALLGYYTVLSSNPGNPLPTFWDNLSVPSSMVKKSKKKRKLARLCAVYIREGMDHDW
jgi:hypothetical protein